MQMRFDGMIGFAGGLVDPGEEVCEGLNRELKEEANLDLVEIFLKFHNLLLSKNIKYIFILY
jgi:8-oxo-dGTP pyrophosphatase MutT (NUDIX family)